MIERLEFDSLDPALQESLRPRVERLGYLGEYFKVAGHQPKAALLSIALTEALKVPFDQQLVEVVALTQAAYVGNAYERVQHERLALTLGYPKEWIAEVIALQPRAARSLSSDHAAVQEFVLAMLSTWGRNAQRELAAVVAALGSDRAVALQMLVAKYAADSLFMNVNELQPNVPSIFAGAAS